MKRADFDAVVVGSGPNGLAAAITIARAGRSVLVLEGEDRAGGGLRTEELTLPGFLHDVCAAVHPWVEASPVLGPLPLRDHGVELVHSPVELAHPLEGEPAAVLLRSVDATADDLGGDDGRAYRRLVGGLAERWDEVTASILGPIVRPPRHPLALARFGLPSLLPAATLARRAFDGPRARALFTGNAAHAILPLTRALTSAAGLVLMPPAHTVGWPVVKGGTGQLAAGLVSYLRALGGEIETGHRIRTLGDIPPARATLLDVSARQLAAIAGDRFPSRYRRRLERYRLGAGVFKVDYALDGPVPWKDERCGHALTVHLGGTLEEIVAAEAEVAAGKPPDRPFVLTAQQSLFDPIRAPAGKHTFWAYCHVPNGCTVDMTERIEDQIERFAPGFRDVVLARSSWGPAEFEAHNPNLHGGDIAGGSNGGLQLFFRPTVALRPYRTPVDGLYLCSASSPPGGGVHGMCGYWAARSAMRDRLK